MSKIKITEEELVNEWLALAEKGELSPDGMKIAGMILRLKGALFFYQQSGDAEQGIKAYYRDESGQHIGPFENDAEAVRHFLQAINNDTSNQ